MCFRVSYQSQAPLLMQLQKSDNIKKALQHETFWLKVPQMLKI